MLHDILNLDGVKKLNKKEQHDITGQGCCLNWECIRDADCNNPEQVCEFGRCLYFI